MAHSSVFRVRLSGFWPSSIVSQKLVGHRTLSLAGQAPPLGRGTSSLVLDHGGGARMGQGGLRLEAPDPFGLSNSRKISIAILFTVRYRLPIVSMGAT